jgi:Fe-S-cluster containining protein
MGIFGRDAELVQIRDSRFMQTMDVALADAALRAGSWLACRPGCTQCCHGAFAINALDALRLHFAMHAADPETAATLRQRARAWLETYGADFPGDPATGLLGTSEEEQTRFESFADDAPCPALNPDTGLCDVYAHRPTTCRVFGPPTRLSDEGALGCCDLCFVGASEGEVAACEMPVPRELEAELLAELGDSGETLVAFALLR